MTAACKSIFIAIWISFAILYATPLATPIGEKTCDKSKCPEPSKEETNCEPVYNNANECCPSNYKCSDVTKARADKCYANGHEYEIGQMLKDEDAQPCQRGCTCVEIPGQESRFSCLMMFDCPYEIGWAKVKPGCHLEKEPNQCCSKQVCPGGI